MRDKVFLVHNSVLTCLEVSVCAVKTSFGEHGDVLVSMLVRHTLLYNCHLTLSDDY